MPAHKIPRELLESTKWTPEGDPTYIKFEKISQVLNNEEDQAVQQLAFNVRAHTSGNAKASGLKITVTMDDGEPTGADTGYAHGIRAIMIDELPVVGDAPDSLDHITPMAIRINQGWQTSVRTPDNCDLIVGFSNDSGLRYNEETTLWPDADSTTTDGVLVLFVSNASQTLHVTDRAGREDDFGLSDFNDPAIVIHSSAASYSSGTVEYDHDTLTVILTGGTWPTYAANSNILVDAVLYNITGRVDDTHLTLGAGDPGVANPGVDVAAGTAYTLYRSSGENYLANYLKIGQHDGTEARIQVAGGDLGVYHGSNKLLSVVSDAVNVHSNATPTTDYLKISHDGDECVIQVAGGDLALKRGSTAVLTLTTDGITLANAQNFTINATTGTKIGTGVGQKIGFWNKAPVVQPLGAAQAAPAAYGSGAFGLDSDANMQALYDLVVAMRTALVTTGIIKGSA